MKLVAYFKDGAFVSVTEGLMVDSSGNYYVGGELPLPVDRVKSMDSAGELEWLGVNPLNAVSTPVEMPTDSITPTEKKSKIPLVVAAVVAVIVVAVAAVLVTNNIRAITEQDGGSAQIAATQVETGISIEPNEADIPSGTEQIQQGSDLSYLHPDLIGHWTNFDSREEWNDFMNLSVTEDRITIDAGGTGHATFAFEAIEPTSRYYELILYDLHDSSMVAARAAYRILESGDGSLKLDFNLSDIVDESLRAWYGEWFGGWLEQ